MNELKGEERDRGEAIERLRDSSAQGPFNAMEARAAEETAAKVSKDAPFIDPASVEKVIAAVGGAYGKAGGGEFTAEMIARLAVLENRKEDITIDLDLPAKKMEEAMRAALAEHREFLDKVFEREALQAGASVQQDW